MPLMDSMAPSPKKSSKSHGDAKDKKSSKKSKKSSKGEERYIVEDREDFRDRGPLNTSSSRDEGKDKTSTERKRKRSRSPKYESPSSSHHNQSRASYEEIDSEKRYRHPSSERRYREEDSYRSRKQDHEHFDFHDHRGSSPRSGSGQSRSGSRDYRDKPGRQQAEGHHRSSSPRAPKRQNEAYVKPLPPGAKGNLLPLFQKRNLLVSNPRFIYF